MTATSIVTLTAEIAQRQRVTFRSEPNGNCRLNNFGLDRISLSPIWL